MHHTIVRDSSSKEDDPDKAIYNGNKAVGEFMKKKVFEPGRTLSWNALDEVRHGEGAGGEGVRTGFAGRAIKKLNRQGAPRAAKNSQEAD